MIHVLIERHIATGLISTYQQQLRTAMQQNYVAHGFVSGESFTDTNDDHHQFLLCKWRTVQDWQRWSRSAERLELANTIKPVLSREERITILEN
ncbi:MAG: heme-degrading monooxygenase HmoA [Flavobacteriales bacterium]|jgi:heme-degrading monooxygenase HmoA